MWRLTITQKNTGKNYSIDEKAVFESEDIFELVVIVEKLRNVDKTRKTEYEIKNIEKEKENEQS